MLPSSDTRAICQVNSIRRRQCDRYTPWLLRSIYVGILRSLTRRKWARS